MKKDAQAIIDFLHDAEKLKTVLRHSWLSNDQQESVAEHSWRMALMAMLLVDHLDKPVDLARALKIIVVHDLCEINYRDNPAFKAQPADKIAQERKSLAKLLRPLSKDQRIEFLDLWEEYAEGKTPEAKFAKAIDKLEVLLQHNEADIKFLTKEEFPYNFIHGQQYCEYDSFLKTFRSLLNDECLKIYHSNNVDESLYKEALSGPSKGRLS